MAEITYASNGKRDFHNHERDYDLLISKLENTKWKYDNNRKIVTEYLRAEKLGKAKSGKSNKKIGKSTLLRQAGLLELASEEWIKKDFDKATKEDWDKFYEDMENDKIKITRNTLKNKKYKQGTKSKIYKTLRKFLKYQYGENKFYPEFCSDWVTTEEKTNKEHLSKTEIDRLIEATNSLKIKTLIITLFDSGLRAEELANLKWSDLELTDKGYYKIHVRPETSKTRSERYITLPIATDFLKSYKNSLENKHSKINPDDFLFNSGYNVMYTTISKVGKRVLNKKISPHTLRHSSATYYASIIKTYQNFCARYGWKLRSEAPQRYFHTLHDDQVTEQSEENELNKNKNSLIKLKLENENLKDTLDDMKKNQEELAKQIKEIQKATMTKAIKELAKKIK